MLAPQDSGQLRSFLCMISPYGKFIPNLSRKCHLFHDLLKKEALWKLIRQYQIQFQQLKSDSVEAPHLVLFELKLLVVSAADAHNMASVQFRATEAQNGNEKPIAHASKSLTEAENNYGLIEKEALATV